MSESTLPTPGGAVSSWARGVAGHPSGPVSPATAALDVTRSGTRASRRTLAAYGAAIVGSPLAMTAWFLVEPSVLPREEPGVFLASVATSPDRYLAGTLLLALSALLAVPAAIGVARLLRPRLPRLGAAVGLLMFLSGVGLAAQVGFRGVVWSMVDPQAVPASSVETYTRFQGSGFFDALVAPGLVFGGLATLLLIGCLVRTRLVPLWVPGALFAGMVLASGEFTDVVTVAGAALGAVANGWLVRALLRRD
jgi:hypothetical protein